MTDEIARRFAALLQLALAGRPLRFIEQPDKLFEIAEVRSDGKVRIKPHPMTDSAVSRSDYIVEPWSLEEVRPDDSTLPADLVPDAIVLLMQRKPKC